MFRIPWRRQAAKPEETKDWTLDAPGIAMFELFAGGARSTSSGETVGPESAMRCPAALGAMRTIAETLASLPLQVCRRGAGNSREVDYEHPANAVLRQPAPWQSGLELRLALAYDAMRHGQAFAYAVRGGGKVREMHRALWGSMTYGIDAFTQEPSYRLSANGVRIFGWQDVVHVTPLPPSQVGTLAMSLVSAAAEPIGMAQSMARHGGNLFRNGARPGGAITLKKPISPSAFERLKASWKRRFSGEGAGETAILEDGATWTSLVMNSVDAQYLETWRFQILEISRVFRVPPHMLAELDRATHANSEELGLQFVAYCMRPRADLFESAFERVLLTPEERQTYYLEHDFDDLEKGNMTNRLDALGKAVVNGVYTFDEARAKENLAPKYDSLRVPLNSVEPGTARDMGNPASDAVPQPPTAMLPPKLRAVP